IEVGELPHLGHRVTTGPSHAARGRVRLSELLVVRVLQLSTPGERVRHPGLTRAKEKEHASLRLAHDARILAFCASNSASVRMPCAFRSARSFNCETVSVAVAGAGGAAWAYCCSSCWAQRLACRRETRLETAVAVPATTAVRAIPRRSPGIGHVLLRRITCPSRRATRAERPAGCSRPPRAPLRLAAVPAGRESP